jgi:PepSY-associated TM region
VARPLGTLLRRCIILSHRYLGIAISLLVVMWFASGIMMIYTGGMPVITAQQRLQHLSALDFSRLQLSPAQAAERAGLGTDWTGYGDGRVTLLSILDRPAYRFGDDTTVFADTGEAMLELSAAQCRTVAARYLRLPEEKLVPDGILTQVDQWTLGLGRQMPLHKFAADDGLGTQVYVQPATGEVVMLTTRRSRIMSWVSAIPHWIYFTGLRKNEPLWFQIIVWTSGLACVLAALGLILAVTQFKRTRPFRLAAAIPYSGWIRWHYLTGAIFGVFTLTWAFSGLLSMEPFAWTRAEGLELAPDVFMGGALDLTQFATLNAQTGGRFQTVCDDAVKTVEFTRIQGDPYYLVRCSPGAEGGGANSSAAQGRYLISAKTLEAREEPFGEESMMTRLRAAFPDVPVAEEQRLTEYDAYYYSRERQAPLPVLRVKFGDPAQTWLYIDPQMGRLVGETNRLSRVKRWLYTGLHDLDFSFWYRRRPLWDIAVITLLLGGLASSSIGLFLAIKRLLRLTGKTKAV